MLAEGCIESHARDAAANGYRPIVIGDAIGATSRDLLEASLQSLVLHTHSLPSTDEVLAECTAS
jgi:nicotinamidase-related amidase